MNLKYLSEWKDRVKELVVKPISDLKGKFELPRWKVLKQPDVKDDKEANIVVVACKKYFIKALVKELDINTTKVVPIIKWTCTVCH